MSIFTSKKTAASPAAAKPKTLGSKMLPLEQRFVFDGALASDLHHLGTTTDHPGTDPTHTGLSGDSLLSASQALGDKVLSDHHVSANIDQSFAGPAVAALVAEHNLAPSNHQVAFIDGRLPDIATLVKDIPAGTRVVLINPDKDGVAQMVAALQGQTGITAVHILSHGSDGELELGSSVVDQQTMSTIYRSALASIGANLAGNADILVYGCDFGAGAKGAQATDLLANLTGATVASSTHLVGGIAGASWTLNETTGAIAVQTIDAADWQHDLVTVQASDGGASGYLNQTISGSLASQGSATNPVVAPTFAVSDVDGNPLPVVDVNNQPISYATAHGSVVINADGTYVYTPNTGFSGSDSFTFVVSATDPNNQSVGSATGVESLTINKQSILAQNDTASTDFNTAISGPISGDVTANPTGAPLTYAVTNQTSHGSVTFTTVNGVTTYTYTPNTGYYGTDSFVWSASDASGAENSASAIVDITVAPPQLTTNYGIGPEAVTANPSGSPATHSDSLPLAPYFTERTPGATVTFSDPSDPSLQAQHGTVSYDNVHGTFTYTPTPGFTGTDTFNILATDSNGHTTLIPVNYDVEATGYGQLWAGPDTNYVTQGNTLSHLTPSTWESYVGASEPGKTFAYTGTPAEGKLIVNGDGTYSYKPEPGPVGLGSFTIPYTVTDVYGQVASNVETIVVSAPPLSTGGVVDYAAIGATVNLNLDAQSQHSSTDPWVVGGTDPFGNAVTAHLTYSVTQQPLHGVVTVNPTTGAAVYTPNPGWSGVDSFNYSVSDGYHTVSATDTIVSPSQIFASSDSHLVAQGSSYSGTVADISGSPAGGQVWTDRTAPKHGTISFNPDGSYTYTPTAGYQGIDSITYSLKDATGHIAKNAVFFYVPSVTKPGMPDTPPTSQTIPDQTNFDSDVVGSAGVPAVNISAYFKDNTPGTSLTYSAAGLPAGLSIDPATGVITGTIDHDASAAVVSGHYPVTIYADDGDGGVTQQTFTWTSVNEPPVAANHTDKTPASTPVNGDVATGVSDPNTGDILTYSQASSPSNGTVTLDPNFAANGLYTYTPNAGFTGTDTFQYTVTDDKGATSTATETILVGPKATNHTDTTPINQSVVGNVSPNDTLTPNSTFSNPTAPAHGTLLLDPNYATNGKYTYTPRSNFTGIDAFQYTVTDPTTGISSTATETVYVGPLATPHSEQTAYVTSVGGNVSPNDIYVSGSTFSIVGGGPANGKVTNFNSSTGTYTYRPNANFTGTDTFQYTVTDPTTHLSSTSTETIQVGPNATPHSETTPINTAVAGNVSANDIAAPNSTFALTGTTPQHGRVTSFNPSTGAYTYQPNSNFTGQDTFQYKVTDPATGLSSVATETILVGPLATPHSATTPYVTAVNGNVSTNDIDASGSTFSVVGGGPANGKVTNFNSSTGTYTYTPNANFTGTDTFQYTVTDPATHLSSTSTETIQVGPDATPHTQTTPINTAVSGNVSANDLAQPNSTFALTGAAPTNGRVTNFDSVTGTYTYTPNANFTGTDTFQYKVTDPATGLSSISTETIQVGPLAKPHGESTAYVTAVGGNVATNDIYQPNSTFAVVGTGPANGTVTAFNPLTGSYTYTPKAGFTGIDTFQYTVTDPATGLSSTSTETIKVGPNATPHSETTPINTAAVGNILPNDIYENGSTFALSGAGPANGTVTAFNSTTGAYTYTPKAGFTGTDTFQYTITDPATGLSATATETIKVGPLATPHSETTPFQTAVGGNVAPNDIYAAGSSFSVVGAGPTHGTLSNFNGTTGAYTYTPANGFTGIDTFQYTVTDPATGLSSTSTETIKVGPNATPHSETTPINTAVAGNILPNDVYENGSTFALSGAGPANGTVTAFNSTTGAYTYTPKAGFTGTDTFQYTITDPATGLSATATETIKVGPLATPHSETTPFQTAVGGNVAPNDIYAAGSSFSVVGAGPAHGTLSNFNSTTGGYTYIPANGFTGIDTFQYTVTDPATGLSSTSTETIVVGPHASNDSYTTPYETAVAGTANGNDIYLPNSVFTLTSNPAHGTLTNFDPSTGNYTYTPANNYAGADSFTYLVTDPNGQTSSATETITITPPKIAAVNDGYATAYETSVAGAAGGNDTYVPNSVFSQTSQPAHGTVTFHSDGTYVYTPAADFAGTDSFTYQVKDPTGQIATATETITVAPPAIAAVNDSYTTPYETLLNGAVTGNDTFAAGSTFLQTSNPAHGTVTFKSDGTYIYTPAAHFAGTDSFTYKIVDPTGQVATATETITVSHPAIAAANDSYSTAYLTPVNGAAGGNDTYAPQSIFAQTSSPAHGIVKFNPDGTYTYTPSAAFAGTDSFTYSVTDPTGQVATATETITVAKPFAPVAVNDGYSTAYETPVTGAAATGDSFVSGSAFAKISNPANGTVSFNPDGTYTYTPNAGFAGKDSFQYTVTDPTGQTSTATETITVTPPAIGAVNDSYTTPYDTPVPGSVAGNDTYAPQSTFAQLSNAAHGTVSNFDPTTGTYTYTPANGFAGTDSFTYTITDPTGQIATATETIKITPPPIAAANDSYTTPYQTQVAGAAATGDTYAPGSVFAQTSNPGHGSVVFHPDGTYTYTPANGFAGTDSFTYSVTDPTGQTSTATETITITPPPILATDHSTSTGYQMPAQGAAAVNDIYASGSTFAAVTSPAHGSLSFNPDGTYVYTPVPGFGGTDTFTYKITDPTGQVSVGTETITVGKPTPPVAVSDSYTTAYGSPVNGAAATGDSYAPGSTFHQTSNPVHGTVQFNSDGTYTYTPATGFSGTDSFTYMVTDQAGQTSTAMETITVQPKPPINAVGHTHTGSFGATQLGNAALGDTVPAGSLFKVAGSPRHGTVVMGSNGTYTYTPARGFSGIDQFTYTIISPTGVKATATETITVKPGNVGVIYNHCLNTFANLKSHLRPKA